jgi:hypothetical protein
MTLPAFNALRPQPDLGRLRSVQLAVEVIDAVTLNRVTDGLAVTVDGLSSAPIINSGGQFVWLLPRQGGPFPTPVPVRVSVDPGRLPFGPARVDLPAVLPSPPLIRVELPPRRDYPFAAGVGGIRATLVRDLNDSPLQPLTGVPVWLQWQDASSTTKPWMDAPGRSTTDASGDFVAVVRLTGAQQPVLVTNQLNLRLVATYTSVTQHSNPFQVPQGRVIDLPDPAALNKKPAFAWTGFSP